MQSHHSCLIRKRKRMVVCIAIVFLLCVCIAPKVFAQNNVTPSPQVQTYLNEAPFSLEAFAKNPIQTLQTFFTNALFGQAKQLLQSYTSLFAFLLLSAIIGLLLTKSEWVPLLELLVAGGSFLLVCEQLLVFSRSVSDSVVSWRLFLTGYVPVFAGVVASSGETVSASLYSGFFLVAVTALAQGIERWILPLTECFLTLCITSAFWIGEELPEACKTCGKFLKKGIVLVGVLFTIIFGIQRVFAVSADGAVLQIAKTLGGAVPIVGQSVSDAASALLAGMKVIKTGLGFAAIAIIGSSFVPLYAQGALQLVLLSFCGFLSKLFSLPRVGKLFDCLTIAFEAMLALVALFFFMVVSSTALMLLVGIGG